MPDIEFDPTTLIGKTVEIRLPEGHYLGYNKPRNSRPTDYGLRFGDGALGTIVAYQKLNLAHVEEDSSANYHWDVAFTIAPGIEVIVPGIAAHNLVEGECIAGVGYSTDAGLLS